MTAVKSVNAHDLRRYALAAGHDENVTLPCRCGGRRGHNILPAVGGCAGRSGGVSALSTEHRGAAAGGRGHGAPCAGVQVGVSIMLPDTSFSLKRKGQFCSEVAGEQLCGLITKFSSSSIGATSVRPQLSGLQMTAMLNVEQQCRGFDRCCPTTQLCMGARRGPAAHADPAVEAHNRVQGKNAEYPYDIQTFL